MLTIEAFLARVPEASIDKKYYQQTILKYRNACGCGSGAAFFLLALAGYLIFLFNQAGSLKQQIPELTLYGILIVFIAGFVGKVLGLVAAKIKLYILYRVLIYKCS